MRNEGNFVDLARRNVRKMRSLWRFMMSREVWTRALKRLRREDAGCPPLMDPMSKAAYGLWMNENEEKVECGEFEYKYRPLFSILMPVVGSVKSGYLRKSIESVLGQNYENFEVCMVGDTSSLANIKRALNRYKRNEKVKIEFREEKGSISRVLNDALNMAKGEYVALLDVGDVLEKNALFEMVKVLNENGGQDLIYSDEDRIDSRGRRYHPRFKPDWSPDTLLGFNYIHRLAIVRTELVRKLGGFAVGMDGGQDYDLFLRVGETTDKICHIPKVLYHWRENNDYDSGGINRKVIEEALKRRGIRAKVKRGSCLDYYYVAYNLKKEPMVSVIIPTKDYAEVTRTCLESVFRKTTYKNYEVIVVDNRSEEDATFELFDEYRKKYKNFRVIDADMEFNYSKINNLAVEKARGGVIILLNNDTEIITPEWMTWMVGYAIQPHVGAVGAKLLYPDGKIQHAGVVLGLGQSRVAGHAYVDKDRDEIGVDGRLCIPYDYSAVTAACLCVEKKKFKEVGGLNEKLKIAFNDVDFNLKLLDKGYYNVFLPMVELYHYESRSRGIDTLPEKQKRFEQEMALMKKKWGERLIRDWYYNTNYSLDASFVLKRKDEK